MICGPLPKTLNICGPLLINKIPSFVLGFAISRESYLMKTSTRGPGRTAPLPPRTSTRGPGRTAPLPPKKVNWNKSTQQLNHQKKRLRNSTNARKYFRFHSKHPLVHKCSVLGILIQRANKFCDRGSEQKKRLTSPDQLLDKTDTRTVFFRERNL